MDKYTLMSREEIVAEALRLEALLKWREPLAIKVLFVRELDEPSPTAGE